MQKMNGEDRGLRDYRDLRAAGRTTFYSRVLFFLVSGFLLIQIQGCAPQCRQNFVERAMALFKNGECSSETTTQTPQTPESPDEGTIDPIAYTVTFPTSSQKYWLTDQSTLRTVTFSHNADSVECSRDNGSTYGSCDSSTTLIWNVADYSVNHKVRFIKQGLTSEVYSFNPSTQFTNLVFFTCTETVSANESFSDFTSRLSSSNKVICLNDGVTITRPSATADNQITFAASDITILAKTKSQATFVNSNNSAGTSDQRSLFDVSGRSNINFYGLKMTTVDGGSSYGIKVQSSSQNIVIDSCEFINTGTSGTFYGVYVTGSGATQAIKVKNSTFTLAGSSNYGMYAASSAVVEFSGNNVSSLYRGVYSQFSAQVTSSSNSYTITSSGIAFDIFQSSLTSSLDIINDSVGLGIVLLNNGGNGGATSTYVTNGTTYKRKNANTGNTNGPVIKINNATGTYVVNSTTNNNLACNENTSAVGYGSYISGTATGSFDSNAQLNGNPASFSNCP